MSSRIYIVLKAANLAAATLWSFALVFVLIRTLPLHAYSVAVLVSALGGYVMAVDLGFSSVIYNRVRAAFLDGDASSVRPLTLTTFGLYTLVVAVATLAFGTQIGRFGTGEHAVAFTLFFLSSILSLPWAVVRASAAATDNFIRFEAIELARRVGTLVLVLLMLRGLEFLHYALLSVLLWAFAWCAMLPAALRQLGASRLSRSDWNLRTVLEKNRTQIGAASVFSLAGFAIVNFPYLALPLLFHRPLDVIPFDVFNKVTRFGWQAYLVANEGMLPTSTRAIHRGDRTGLMKAVGVALGLSTVPCVCGAIAVTVFGDRIFGLLLNDATLVPESLRWGMACMFLVLMFQAPAEIVLLNTGKILPLARIRVAMLVAMAVVALAASSRYYEFNLFMAAYVGVFLLGTILFFAALVRSVHTFGQERSAW